LVAYNLKTKPFQQIVSFNCLSIDNKNAYKNKSKCQTMIEPPKPQGTSRERGERYRLGSVQTWNSRREFLFWKEREIG
jgi:hypothetical protein